MTNTDGINHTELGQIYFFHTVPGNQNEICYRQRDRTIKYTTSKGLLFKILLYLNDFHLFKKKQQKHLPPPSKKWDILESLSGLKFLRGFLDFSHFYHRVKFTLAKEVLWLANIIKALSQSFLGEETENEDKGDGLKCQTHLWLAILKELLKQLEIGIML